MKWNISAEAISLVILGIIWVYSRKGSHLPTLKNRVFQSCLVVTFSAILTNILSTVMIIHYEQFPIWLTWLVTMVYFILTPLMGLAYFMYTVSVIYTDSRQIKRVIGAGLLPGGLYIILMVLNLFTKNIFDINGDQGYVRGALIPVTYIIFYVYCIASIAVTLINYKKMDRKLYRILASFPILAFVVIIFQEFYPEVILSGSAATCALLIIYLHLQNKQISVDYLTNVPNRQELLNTLEFMLEKNPNRKFVLLVVSLRDFRQINHTCGQLKGDEFLRQVCDFLRSVGPENNVFRYSGDEFALLFSQDEKEDVKQCVEWIEKRMTQSWQVKNYCFILSAVMGIIYHTKEGETLEELVDAIEYATHQAKTGKYGSVCYCDRNMLDKLDRKNKIIQILKDQLSNQSFELYYQPIYCVDTGTYRYAESLMRIPDSPIGPVYPSEFIPIAEETGLIIEITYMILDKVCKFINELLEKEVPIGSVHVNFSGIQFSQPNLAGRVLEIIEKNHTPKAAIKIEFTESTLAESTQAVTEFALEMKRHGIKMGLDDFGTGYSNIATVINIPFGTAKLDKSLVWGAVDNKKSALAVKNLTDTFKELGMKVIAEGVETEEQRDLMVEFGVDQIQGFYYAKPMPKEEALEFLQLQNIRKKKAGHSL